jgi:hypothetical protein
MGGTRIQVVPVGGTHTQVVPVGGTHTQVVPVGGTHNTHCAFKASLRLLLSLSEA